MKVFYTPAIDGEYRTDLQKRLEDMNDNVAYATVEKLTGEDGVDHLADYGYVKVLDRDSDGTVKGVWTYQQQDL